MKQRHPGDYIQNDALPVNKIQDFLDDCVMCGAKRGFVSVHDRFTLLTSPEGMMAMSVNTGIFIMLKDVTHEYQQEKPMKRPELLRQMADAMERDTEKWWKEFYIYSHGLADWCVADSVYQFWWYVENAPDKIRPRPRTFTLHIEDMPEPMRCEPDIGEEFWVVLPGYYKNSECEVWQGGSVDRYWLACGICYPDEATAQLAYDKLAEAMGGGE